MSKIIPFPAPAAPTKTTIDKAYAALAAVNRARAAAEKAAAQEAQEEAAAYTPEAFAAIGCTAAANPERRRRSRR